MLSDARRSQTWVVMLAEPLPDRETRRLIGTLREMNTSIAGVFVNRVLLEARGCSRCLRRQQWQRLTLSKIRDLDLPVLVVPEYSQEIAGKRGLQRLTERVWRVR